MSRKAYGLTFRGGKRRRCSRPPHNSTTGYSGGIAWRPRNQIRPIRNRMQRRSLQPAKAKLQSLWARQQWVPLKLLLLPVCRLLAHLLGESTSGDEVWFGAPLRDFSGLGLSRFSAFFFHEHFLNLLPFSKLGIRLTTR